MPHPVVGYGHPATRETGRRGIRRFPLDKPFVEHYISNFGCPAAPVFRKRHPEDGDSCRKAIEGVSGGDFCPAVAAAGGGYGMPAPRGQIFFSARRSWHLYSSLFSGPALANSLRFPFFCGKQRLLAGGGFPSVGPAAGDSLTAGPCK